VYRLVHAGELPALRFGPVYRIPEKSLRVVREILPRSA
jgi:excisionase family DNA binding protein